MGKDTVTTADTVSGPHFIALVFSVAGWAVLELFLLQIGAGGRAHCMTALFGLLLGYLSIRRPRIGRPGLPSAEIGASQHHRLGRAELGWVLLFVVAGAVLGTLVLEGDTIILGIVTISLALAPWSRMHFCRSYLLLACTAVWTGMVSVIVPGRSSIAPMFLPIASWVLWASTLISLFLRIERLSRAERVAGARRQGPCSTASTNSSV